MQSVRRKELKGQMCHGSLVLLRTDPFLGWLVYYNHSFAPVELLNGFHISSLA